MIQPIFVFLFLIILNFNYLNATDGPARNKQQVDRPENNSSNISRDTGLISNGGLITNNSASNNDFSFIRENAQQTNTRRPVSITSNTVNDYASSIDNDDQLSRDNPHNISQRDLLASGSDPQIAQDELGNLYATFIDDIGGPDGEPDSYTDMVVYKSVDNGTTWDYQFYIFNSSGNHITEPDIETIDDRLLFLYVRGETIRLFWSMLNDSDFGSTALTLPDGYDTFDWGSMMADKFYYDIESTWIYVTYGVWNSTSGEGAIYYTRSTDFGLSFDNLTEMWVESSYTTDIGSDYFYYRGGIAIAYSTAEPGGDVDYVWTTLSMNGDVYTSKLDIYTNTVTNTIVMAADDNNSHSAPSISAYYENIAVFATTHWDDESAQPDVGMTFSYDEGTNWGDDYDWYYWIDNNNYYDYSTAPNFAPDGVMGFAYASEVSDLNNEVNFRTNVTGNFLNGWNPVTIVESGTGDVHKIGSVIQNNVFSLVYDDEQDNEINFSSYVIETIQYGSVSGVITSAVTGSPIQDAIVQIGDQVDYTDASGNYFIDDVSPAVLEANFFAQPLEGDAPLEVQFYNISSSGQNSIGVTKEGYANYFDNTLEVNVGQTTNYNVSLSPLDDNWLRFVLNWDDDPPDLDIHLITETSHIYWDNVGAADQYPYATLDVDVTAGYGPETITIAESSPEPYKLYIHNYSTDPSITESNAVVQCYSYGQPIFTVSVPATGDGAYWHVADINGQTSTYDLVGQLLQSAPEIETGGGNHVIGIDIMTDGYPAETSWDIVDYFSGSIIATGEPTNTNALHEWDIDVPTSDYTFTIYDVYGDGICCSYGSGYYTIYVDGSELQTSYFSGAEESVYIDLTAGRGNGGTFQTSRASYVDPVPFEKGTILSDEFVESWPMNEYVVINQGNFGEGPELPEPKPLNHTREITHTWDFGDGYTSSSDIPTHTYNAAGAYTVTLTATDGANISIFQRTNYINVSTGGENTAPIVVDNIEDHIFNPGEDISVNLSSVFSDADGDVLAYDVVNSNASIVNASISGTYLNLVAISAGTATITITATDQYGAFATDEFNVQVNAGNSPPLVFNEIPDVGVVIGEVLEVDLISSQVFIDSDGDNLSFTVTSANSSIASANITVSILTVEGITAGIADIVVVADDGNGGSASTQFSVTVSTPGVFSGPELDEFPTITLDEDGTSEALDLDEYVSDSDTELEDLFWFASLAGAPGILVQIDPLTHILTVHGMNDWNGQTQFTILVSDGANLAMGLIEVVVNPINDPPIILPISGIAFMEDENMILPINQYVVDIDNAFSSLVFSTEGNINVQSTVNNESITFNATADWYGQEQLTLDVSDGEYSTATTFNVVVVPVNDPPIFNNLIFPNDGEELENSEVVFSWEPASDVDVNELLTYHIGVYSDEQMNDLVGESSGQILEAEIMLSSGSYYWSVIVSDSEGETSISELRTFTLSVNSAPMLSEIESQSMDEDASYELMLSATDQNEEDILTFTATSSTSDAMVSVTNDTLRVELAPNWFGVVDIEVYVTDGELSDTTFFQLVVNAVNDAPEVFGLISPADSTVIAITPQDISENLALLVNWEESSDVDGDNLSYGFALFNGAYAPDAMVLIDTTLSETMIQISYEAIAQLIVSLSATSINGDWTVYSTDGIDTIMSEDIWHITMDASALLSLESDVLPQQFALHQNYPNPFNPSTFIPYNLPQSSFTSISIFDLKGNKINTILNQQISAGFHSVIWDARNDLGKKVSAGVYIYTIQAGEFRQVRKMVLLK
jgi:PKD repeat protein